MKAIVEKVRQTVGEACESSSPYLTGRLIYASRIIMDMYRDVLQVSHKAAIEQFPQHSSLAFTNCMFLAYNCIVFGYEFREQLNKIDGNMTNGKGMTLTFADMVVKLRNVGIEVFQAQLRRQRDQLLSIIQESGFSQLQGEANLPPQTEKSLKQILHQMHHLRTVWQHILPSHVYGRSMGILLNFIVDDIVQRVVNLEDIAADSAVQISSIFTLVEEKAPEVFIIEGDSRSSKHDVVRFVRVWQRFRELILVLNASLKEIEDRWAGGKGPLAVEFTVEEMKRMIRALFQNTDRRAAVLARIKYEG